MEIERKFLVRGNDNLDVITENKVEILQTYLSLSPEVRLRKVVDYMSKKFLLTIKGEGTIQRQEFEIEVEESTFSDLYSRRMTTDIQKIRHIIPYLDHTIELDYFLGEHKGLVVAEVEFKSLEAASQFIIPEWFGIEITNDKSFKNKNLVKIIRTDN